MSRRCLGTLAEPLSMARSVLPQALVEREEEQVALLETGLCPSQPIFYPSFVLLRDDYQ